MIAKTCAYILTFKDENDEQSVKLQKLLQEKEITKVIKEITEYNNNEVAENIAEIYKEL